MQGSREHSAAPPLPAAVLPQDEDKAPSLEAEDVPWYAGRGHAISFTALVVVVLIPPLWLWFL